MISWLSRLALRLVPPRWREPVLRDLSEEAAGRARTRCGPLADFWRAWHIARVGARFRLRDAATAVTGPSRVIGGHTFGGLFADVRLALRMIGRQPASTAAIVLTLAIGIGATAAAYAVFNTILFRPVPGIRDPERLVTVTLEAPSKPGVDANYSASRLIAALEGTAGLDGPAASYKMTVPVIVGERGDPERDDVMAVRGHYLSILGVQTRIGRMITDAEAIAGADVALISERFWRSRFAASPNAIGSSLRVDGRAYSIVGVVAAYQGWGATRVGTVAAWITGGSGKQLSERVMKMDEFLVIGRLQPGSTRAEVAERLRAAYRHATPPGDPAVAFVPVVYPGLHLGGPGGFDTTGQGGTDDVTREAMAIYPLAMGATSLLLLLACANAANLLLARIAGRRQVLALRAALGAGRGRLIRGILVEAAVLAVGSTVVGLGIAALLSTSLSGVRPFRGGPTLIEVPIDWRVAVFASAIAALTLLAFGAAPALAGSNVDVRGLLPQSGRGTTGRRRTQQILVVLQLALALTLVAGAGVLARSVARLRALDLGMRPDQVVEFSIDPLDGGPELTDPDQYLRRVLAAIERTAGVRAAGIAAPPAFASFSPRAFLEHVRASDAAGPETLQVIRRHVSGGYFSAVGIPLVAGRTFTPDEYSSSTRLSRDAPVVVSENLARRAFGGIDVVGRHLRVTPTYDDSARYAVDVEIVGVVGDTRSGWDYLHDGGPTIYEADRATYMVNTFYVRSGLAPPDIQDSLRKIMRGIEPRLPLRDEMTLRQEFDALFPEERTIADLMRLVAGLALTLGLFGVASVMSCTLAERTRELGVRVALGASTRRLTRDVLRPALATALVGAGIGLALFASVSGILSSHIHGISALDPLTLAGATLLLVAAALTAAWIPTRRLSRTDPTIALRAD